MNDPLAGYAEAFGNIDIIGLDALQVAWIAEEGMTTITAVEAVFPLHNHAEVLVVQNNCLCGDALDVRGGELLDIHEE